MKIRILLADDHTILRAGLKMMLNAQPDMEVVGEAQDVTGGQIPHTYWHADGRILCPCLIPDHLYVSRETLL